MNNKIRALRIKHGISQRELANRVGTSQQQIQRVETGQVAARLELATKLSQTLGVPLTVLFPSSKKALGKFAKEIVEEPKYLPSETAYVNLERTGIEADARVWTILIRLKGHRESIKFQIEPGEQRRLFRVIQNEKSAGDAMSFVVFVTEHARVGVNLRELTYCHFLFDGPGAMDASKQDAMENRVLAYLSGDSRPLDFGVDPDEESADEEEDEGTFRNIFFEMETYVEEQDRFHFEDEDGEDVFLRAGDLALLQVPLWVISPETEDEEDDDED
ncbi:MAG TPA: helix-turn-helix domain-containing protein, partial [Pyrinomonadaceae bacterium]|nr:helix-turn-helix domain-containing protein [Pyrinomonadaceae bacterium]